VRGGRGGAATTAYQADGDHYEREISMHERSSKPSDGSLVVLIG
jgi:hypothetical protein